MKYYYRPITPEVAADRADRKLPIGAPHFGVAHKEPLVKVPEEYHFEGLYQINPREQDLNPYTQEMEPRKGVVHEYYGPLLLDVDMCQRKKIFNLNDAWEITAKLIDKFKTTYKLSFSTPGYNVYFSGGKGYHIEIDPYLQGLENQEYHYAMPAIHKNMLISMKMLDMVDDSLYCLGTGKRIRLPNRNRLLSEGKGLCKILLTKEEFEQGPSVHRTLAKTPRTTQPVPALPGEANKKLAAQFQKALESEAERKEVGLNTTTFKKLLDNHADTPDCVNKLLTNHETVDDSQNFHEITLKLAIFFKHAGLELNQVLAKTDNWVKGFTRSGTFPSESARRAHLNDTWRQVEGTDYNFSCTAMRKSVDRPDCCVCPLNAEVDFERVLDPADQLHGVFMWQKQYMTIVKRGQEYVNSLLCYGVVIPEMVALPDRDGEGPSGSMVCRISRPEEPDVDGVHINMNDIVTLEQFNVLMAAKLGQNAIGFVGTKTQWRGVLRIISIQSKTTQVFTDAGYMQGPWYGPGNRWYWIDSGIIKGQKRSRNSDWELSANVALTKKSPGAPEEPWSDITCREPYATPNEDDSVDDLVRLIQQINTPSFIYPLLGWSIASMFRVRIKHLEKSCTGLHLKNHPVLFAAAASGSGKSETIDKVLKALCCLNPNSVHISTLTTHSIRSSLIPVQCGVPIFIDEVNSQHLNTRGTGASMTGADVNNLWRAAWDQTAYVRGTADSVKSAPFNAALCMIGESTPDLLDPAAQQRTVWAMGDPVASKRHLSQWTQFENNLVENQRVLGKIGATFAKLVLSISDGDLSRIYEKACSHVTEYVHSQDRREAGLGKVVFGCAIWKQVFPRSWDYEASVSGILASEGVEADVSKDKRPSGALPKRLDRVVDDCSDILQTLLTMFEPHTPLDELSRPRDGVAFRVEYRGTRPYLWLNVKMCLNQLKIARNRNLIAPGSGTTEKDFIKALTQKAFLIKVGKAYVVRTAEFGGGVTVPGPWVKLDCHVMERPESARQIEFCFDAIPGYKKSLKVN